MRTPSFVAAVGVVAIAACGGASVGSAIEAEDVVRQTIREDRICSDSGGVSGDVECTPRDRGWACSFGVTGDALTGTIFVGDDGHAEYASIC